MRFGHRFESRYYQRSTLNDGLIVAWPLNEASGTRYPDYGGTEFNLSDVNTVGTADAPPGIGGLCASFDGSTEYLYCADPFPPPAALSAAAWFYLTANPGVGLLQSVLHKGRSGTGAAEWALANENVAGTIRLTSTLSANGSALTRATSASAPGTSAWYFGVLVWDGATVTTYLNNTPGTPVAFASALHNGTDRLGFGSNGYGTGNFMPGRIAQPLIWRRALTSTEITYLYNSGNGRPLTDWL